jgi:CubicO group peptidase (beta-lactamase class C family)
MSANPPSTNPGAASGARRHPQPDFSALHAVMQTTVDGELLAGVSSAVLVGSDVVDTHCAGWADREQREPLRPDHLFRMYSSTKLIASCAALLFVDEGRIGLDEPIDGVLPQLARRRVLRPGATSLADTEPARRPITLRQLLSHSSGKGYGLGGAVTLAEAPGDPPDSVDEFQWGGMAGTHWWINPRRNIAGIVMAQRDIAFWHPFSFDMKRAVCAALG